MNEDLTNPYEVPVQKESVKLVKNSKGYTWELKLLPTGDRLDDIDLHRLKAYSERLEKEYGGQNV